MSRTRWLSGYTCCNLRYELGSDRIGDGNFTINPFIPAGQRIRVGKPHRDYWAWAEINGVPVQLVREYGGTAEPFEDWARRLVVAEDPKAMIAAWPPAVQRAIERGKIIKGMTREQVVVSIGHPPKMSAPDFKSPVWRYWQSPDLHFEIDWQADRVANVRRMCPVDEELQVLMTSDTGR